MYDNSNGRNMFYSVTDSDGRTEAVHCSLLHFVSDCTAARSLEQIANFAGGSVSAHLPANETFDRTFRLPFSDGLGGRGGVPSGL